MSTPNDSIYLSWSDVIPDRPFTNPDYNTEDLGHLHYMVNRLREVLSQPDGVPDHPRPYVLYLAEADGYSHRIAITNALELMTCNELAVVGFCGQKRPDADRTPLNLVDAELIEEFIQHPYLLSYSSLQLPCGNWRNLVLFSQPRGIGHWAFSAKHTQAASELAPSYYLNIRLHNGVLPGGLMSGNDIILTRTKYYDYQHQPLWWAVRELQA